MREFDHQLLRLKQALGAAEDQAVAAALGLSKAAFADRKKRAAFPADKVKALAADRPELGLDVQYVLTGTTARFDSSIDKLRRASETAQELALPRREQMLVRDILYGASERSAHMLGETIENYVAERAAEKPRKRITRAKP